MNKYQAGTESPQAEYRRQLSTGRTPEPFPEKSDKMSTYSNGSFEDLGCDSPKKRERSEFCVTLKILQRHHIIQPPFKING